jgi:predicted acetyltransferase
MPMPQRVMDGLVVRPAREEDLERMVEIHGASYPVSGSFERQKRDVTRDPWGGLQARRVVEKGGHLLGCGALYALEVWIGGRKVPVGGIASVAVAPEARRQGVARALLTAMHAEMESSGAVLSLLYPFEEGFYARLGYGVTCPLLTLRVPSRKLLSLEGVGKSAGLTTVAADGSRAMALYEEVARLASGRIARSEVRWLERFSKENRYWMGVASHVGDTAVSASDLRLEAYASFSHESRTGDKQPTLVVHELTARDDAAKRALLVAIGRQCDQVETVELAVGFDDALAVGLHGAQGRLERGPMVKSLGARRALLSRGYLGEGDVTLACTDETSAKPLRLSVRSGVAEVSEGSGPADIELSGATLASLVASGLRPTEAAELGLLRCSRDVLRVADAMFAGPRFQCLDPF